MTFIKAAVFGLLGTLTLASSILPANAHRYDRNQPSDVGVSCDDSGYTRKRCLPDLGEGNSSNRPSRCEIDFGMSPKTCRPEWYENSNRPHDNGLPPCGIIYNGPCDPKKGI
jgi:hypothetical protein